MPNVSQSLNPVIRKLDGFARLSDVERTLLQEISNLTKRVDARTTLGAEGERPSGAFLFLEGLACRFKQRRNGRRQVLALLIPGDHSDVDSFQQSQIDHSIETLSSCRIAWIAPEVIAKLQQHPNIARALRTSVLVNEATLRAWLMNVGARPAVERLAHLLCELYVRHLVVGQVQDQSYELPLTQPDLAEIAGLSGVHVNRSLQELRRKQLIEFRHRRVIIRDWPKLQALAEFEGSYLRAGDDANVIIIDEALAAIRTGASEPDCRPAFAGEPRSGVDPTIRLVSSSQTAPPRKPIGPGM